MLLTVYTNFCFEVRAIAALPKWNWWFSLGEWYRCSPLSGPLCAALTTSVWLGREDYNGWWLLCSPQCCTDERSHTISNKYTNRNNCAHTGSHTHTRSHNYTMSNAPQCPLIAMTKMTVWRTGPFPWSQRWLVEGQNPTKGKDNCDKYNHWLDKVRMELFQHKPILAICTLMGRAISHGKYVFQIVLLHKSSWLKREFQF